jgi:ATP-dependent RNA helicase DeaD
MSNFHSLGITGHFIQSLEELGIKTPTEIQEKSIPILLGSSTDFIGQAQTGTGKTAAFGLPILAKANPDSKHIQALVLAPTRELCQQIAKHLFKCTKFAPKKIFVEAVYGGEKIDIQKGRLARATHIVVATPGRLLDLLNQKALSMEHVRTIVMDEADEMLSMGFKEELTQILALCNPKANKWLFSATIPPALGKIIDQFLSPDAQRVAVSKKMELNANIEHQYFICPDNQKFELIQRFIKSMGAGRGILFCQTRAAVQKLTTDLQFKGFSVDALHGDLQQKEREKVMRAFVNKKIKILIATDISARGIDVQDLSYVIHYQLPDQPENYIHRSGRTARAGKRGISISFVNPQEQQRLMEFSKLLGIRFMKV